MFKQVLFYLWSLFGYRQKSLTTKVAPTFFIHACAILNPKIVQIKSSEDLSSAFLWLPLLPSAEESQGAGRLSGTLPLRKNSMSSASNISCFQPIPLAASTSATVTEGSKEGPTRFSCIRDLAQTRSFPSSRHWIWELFKLQQPGLIFVQFKLSCFCHSLNSHNLGEQVDFKKKRTCIFIFGYFFLSLRSPLSLSWSFETLSALTQENRTKISKKYTSISGAEILASH